MFKSLLGAAAEKHFCEGLLFPSDRGRERLDLVRGFVDQSDRLILNFFYEKRSMVRKFVWRSGDDSTSGDGSVVTVSQKNTRFLPWSTNFTASASNWLNKCGHSVPIPALAPAALYIRSKNLLRRWMQADAEAILAAIPAVMTSTLRKGIIEKLEGHAARSAGTTFCFGPSNLSFEERRQGQGMRMAGVGDPKGYFNARKFQSTIFSYPDFHTVNLQFLSLTVSKCEASVGFGQPLKLFLERQGDAATDSALATRRDAEVSRLFDLISTLE